VSGAGEVRMAGVLPAAGGHFSASSQRNLARYSPKTAARYTRGRRPISHRSHGVVPSLTPVTNSAPELSLNVPGQALYIMLLAVCTWLVFQYGSVPGHDAKRTPTCPKSGGIYPVLSKATLCALVHGA